MMSIKELLPKVQEDIFLAPHTTFKIGGKAKYFFVAKTKKDIIQAVKTAQQCGLSFFVLAGGSNVLFSDKGFDGLVIKIQVLDYRLQDLRVCADAGVKLSEILNVAAEAGLSGLEWAAGIPMATVGGAIRGNAGAFGVSIAEVIEEVEALDIRQSKELASVFSVKECEFGYRTSVFKKNNNLIIFSAKIQLQKRDRKKIKEQIKNYKNYRKEHHPLEFPSAGSIFKNPCLEAGYFSQLLSPISQSSHIPFSPSPPSLTSAPEEKEIPVGLLIEKAGLKGRRIGDAQISEKHCNFIINLGQATAKEILELIALIKKEVRNKFNINLEEEIVIHN